MAIERILRLRGRIEAVRGPLVMTEHGRVPVCRSYDEHEQHCFHGHALLFGIEGAAFDPARSYYLHHAEFHTLETALSYAARQQSYLLISRSPDEYEILSHPLNTPRQLARTLAAISAGEPDTADWRVNPRRSTAIEMAAALRTVMDKACE